jgi:hypothetical protein
MTITVFNLIGAGMLPECDVFLTCLWTWKLLQSRWSHSVMDGFIDFPLDILLSELGLIAEDPRLDMHKWFGFA